jgi:hypothetical protein
MKNEESFKEYMAVVGEKFKTEISPIMAKIIWRMLQPYPDDLCIKAIEQVIINGRFFESLLPDLKNQLEGSQSDNATQAWALVDDAMRRVGNYTSINFGDPKIHQCIEMMGGWEYLGTLTEDEWKWKRKEFEAAYKALPAGQGPERVAGKLEKENIARYYDLPVKVLEIAPKKGNPNLLKEG